MELMPSWITLSRQEQGLEGVIEDRIEFFHFICCMSLVQLTALSGIYMHICICTDMHILLTLEKTSMGFPIQSVIPDIKTLATIISSWTNLLKLEQRSSNQIFSWHNSSLDIMFIFETSVFIFPEKFPRNKNLNLPKTWHKQQKWLSTAF